MIPVTKPFSPPIEEYRNMLDGIWEREWFTNNGELVRELEERLTQKLGLNNMLYLTNGTVALQIAIKALGLRGEIITTPFSYVATTSSIVWEGCTAVYADIDEGTLNINPDAIEDVITDRSCAILATHCFGNPCDIERIEEIAKRRGLKVIYDGAHCFGTNYRGKSVFAFGDIATTSFHATKLFHTVEGGAVFSQDETLIQKMRLMRNFGHNGPEKFSGVGINGKNSELHAAMGLCNLKYADEILEKRKAQCAYYDSLLAQAELEKPIVQEGAEINFAYYPVIFKTEEVTLRIKEVLEQSDIFPRRYFYPSLSSLNYVAAQNTPVSDSIAKRILCLPLYHDLSRNDQQRVAHVLINTPQHG